MGEVERPMWCPGHRAVMAFRSADASPRGYATIPHIGSSPRMASPWLIVGPEVAYWGVRQVSELWKPRSIYISENGASADDHALDAHCLNSIARFKRPKRYVYLDALPKNNYGKVLKTELRKMLAK